MKNTKKYLKMSDKEIKSEFIKYFGKDKWNEEEAIENLNDIEYILSEVLVLPTIPVITEDIPEAKYSESMGTCFAHIVCEWNSCKIIKKFIPVKIATINTL